MTSFLKVQSPRLGKSAEVVEMISVYNVRCNLFRAAVSHMSISSSSVGRQSSIGSGWYGHWATEYSNWFL